MMGNGQWAMVALVGAAFMAAPSCSPQRTSPAPTHGRDVIARMHDAYRGRWYNTLVFEQRTLFIRPNGTRDSILWYEAVKGADRLRIDFGSPTSGNGAIFTAESTIAVREGAVTRRIGRGNPFLPLIQGVYLQAPAETERQLAPFGFALDRVYFTTYDSRPTIVVGATSVTDTTSTQFWVDTERWVLLRMLLAPPTGSGPMTDAQLRGYERVADGRAWLATRILIVTGAQQQIEDYQNWRVNVPLDDVLFDPAQWRTAPHWAR